jgi:hypothetical protein
MPLYFFSLFRIAFSSSISCCWLEIISCCNFLISGSCVFDCSLIRIISPLRRRIEALICISFVAGKIYKELERQLKEKKSEQSPEMAIDILKTIYKVSIQTPCPPTKHQRLLIKNQEQKEWLELFDVKF